LERQQIARNLILDEHLHQLLRKLDFFGEAVGREIQHLFQLRLDLNDANKSANKAKLTTNKAENIVKKGEQDLYDFTKEERDKQRNEAREELKTGRKKKRQAQKL
jgi:phosphotransferase system IIB component